MFNKRMTEMEKHLGTSVKMLPLVKKNFEEHEYTLTTTTIDWDKHRVHLVQLSEKVIQLDS